MEALGRVELPTNGLGNKGFHPHPNRLSDLQSGLMQRRRGKSPHSAIIWQRIWQRGASCFGLMGTFWAQSIGVNPSIETN